MRPYGFTRKTLVPLASAMTLAAATTVGALAAPKETVLYSFKAGTSDGAYPSQDVIRDSQGNIYGMTQEGGALNAGVVYKVAPDGTETVLHSFVGGANDGSSPNGAPLLDKHGNLYGATIYGGAANSGVVFKLAPNGKLTLLHSFTGKDDGANPQGALLVDAAGNLYGAASLGGESTCSIKGFPAGSGCGTLWKLAPDGTFTVLHTFENPDKEGAIPQGSLNADAQGNLYGVTEISGEAKQCLADTFENGCGTVFKLTSSGVFSLLHTFTGGSDGGIPYGGLTADAQGNLYGSTIGGGNDKLCVGTGGDDGRGCGTLFKLSPEGTLTTLYTFTGGADGSSPTSRLIGDCDGNRYGTADFGGDVKAKACAQSDGVSGCGAVFKLSASGAFSVLYTFQGSPKDGAGPIFTGVVADSAGNLYGATSSGGADGVGTVYKLTDTGFATTGKACPSAP